jgi:cell division protein FtsI/penicillin-binding protein 2
VGDQLFRCHNLAGHGVLNMQEALEHSCNPYFISLALEIGETALATRPRSWGLPQHWSWPRDFARRREPFHLRRSWPPRLRWPTLDSGRAC